MYPLRLKTPEKCGVWRYKCAENITIAVLLSQVDYGYFLRFNNDSQDGRVIRRPVFFPSTQTDYPKDFLILEQQQRFLPSFFGQLQINEEVLKFFCPTHT
jgi:hypothetical protein